MACSTAAQARPKRSGPQSPARGGQAMSSRSRSFSSLRHRYQKQRQAAPALQAAIAGSVAGSQSGSASSACSWGAQWLQSARALGVRDSRFCCSAASHPRWKAARTRAAAQTAENGPTARGLPPPPLQPPLCPPSLGCCPPSARLPAAAAAAAPPAPPAAAPAAPAARCWGQPPPAPASSCGGSASSSWTVPGPVPPAVQQHRKQRALWLFSSLPLQQQQMLFSS